LLFAIYGKYTESLFAASARFLINSTFGILNIFCMKSFFRSIHLYLALASGLFIMTACFTGSILVFEKELQQAFYPDRYFSNAVKEVQMPIDSILNGLHRSHPDIKVASVKIFTDPKRNLEMAVTQETAQQRTAGKKAEGTKMTAFVDPYSGELVELYVYGESFFYTVMSLHRWLLAGDTGKLIMGISMLFFLVIMVTGVIIWWPKTKALLKQRTAIKWKSGWKRISFDLHHALGIYSVMFLFIFAFTALVWSFQWFNDGIYTLTRSSKDPIKPPYSVIIEEHVMLPTGADNIMADIYKRVPNAISYTIAPPKDASGVFAVTVLERDAAHENATDHYYYDQYSAEYINTVQFGDRPLGQRIRATVKPIHTSSIWGLPSKVLGFVVCLFGTTFPITGVIMWLSRIKKI
jgi:uncharacterized iron-regulated membrane protein